MMKIITRALIIFGLLLMPGFAVAAPYPERPVHIIVPYPPGGGVDGLARPLADRLSKLWKQTVIVENKAGASTLLGGETVARAPKDGYTLFLTSDSSITSNPFLFKKLPFDPVKDLAPVTQLIDLHQMVVVNPSVSANTMQELVSYAKKHPDKLTYGSYGRGSQPNLLFEALRAKTGAGILQVPFRGIAPAILATLKGNADDAGRGGNDGAVHQGWKNESARDWARQAPEGISQCANLSRGRLGRHQSEIVVRPVCSRRHACSGAQ